MNYPIGCTRHCCDGVLWSSPIFWVRATSVDPLRPYWIVSGPLWGPPFSRGHRRMHFIVSASWAHVPKQRKNVQVVHQCRLILLPRLCVPQLLIFPFSWRINKFIVCDSSFDLDIVFLHRINKRYAFLKRNFLPVSPVLPNQSSSKTLYCIRQITWVFVVTITKASLLHIYVVAYGQRSFASPQSLTGLFRIVFVPVVFAVVYYYCGIRNDRWSVNVGRGTKAVTRARING